jgi:deoxyribonuclease-4
MIKFGPSGNSEGFFSAGYKHSEESAKWVSEMGLTCFEYSFGRGVNLSEQKAIEIGNAFKDVKVEISVHAPYYINFANPDDEKAENSYRFVIESAKACVNMGGERIVFHPASQGKMSREKAVSLTVERLKTLRDRIYSAGLEDIIYCPETMGKLGQIGTIEEVVEFCKIDKIYIPCVDFGHVNAREWGSLKTEKDYEERLSYMIDELGFEKMKHFHVHFSKIEFSAKGEVRHLTFEDQRFGPDFTPLSNALKKFKLEPFIICESAGTQDVDAVDMKKIYFN